MIEPTETESKETLDAFADAMIEIARLAAEDPDRLKQAPHVRAGAPPRRGQGGEAAGAPLPVRGSPGPVRRALGAAPARSPEGRVAPLRPWRPTPTPGGARASCTRSTRARSRTPTATASATSAGSSAGSTTSSGSASTGSGSTRRCRRRMPTGATTSRDYTGVHPELGTLDDLDELIRAAAERGIRVLLDLVPNHTSDEHAWFRESRSSRESAKREWYVWADPRRGGGPPNDWRSVFGGPAWAWDDGTGQYYLHSFLAEMPDVNWLDADVRAEFDRIHDFWFARGVAGFRIDVAHRTVRERDIFAPRPGPPPLSAHGPRGHARGLPALAHPRRPLGPAARPRRRDLRRRRGRDGLVLRLGQRRAAPRLQHPVRLRRPRRGAPAPHRRGDRGARCRAAAGRSGRSRTTTSCAARPAGARATSARCAACSSSC